MKLPCSVVRDLLPLHAEQLTEPETAALVEEHLTGCTPCAERFAAMQEGEPRSIETTAPLQNLKKQIRLRRWCTALLAALLVFTILFTCFYHAGSMQLLPWQDELVKVKGVETVAPEDRLGRSYQLLDADAAPPHEYTGEALVLQTDSRVSGWRSTTLEEDGMTTVLLQGASRRSLTRQEGTAEYGELVFYPVPDRVVYGYNGSQHFIWGEEMDGGSVVLPRLVLAYYRLIAAILALALGILWYCLRHKPCAALLRQLFVAPLSWLLAHLLLKGLDAASFFLEGELLCILGLAVAIYGILSLAWLVWKQHRSAAA